MLYLSYGHEMMPKEIQRTTQGFKAKFTVRSKITMLKRIDVSIFKKDDKLGYRFCCNPFSGLSKEIFS
ncbi:MAG TPA: hypothetical protein PK990_01550 [Salinivirgaceae bacterium]|nr:hypothetical protein [Salinivirgaceae bacterium]